MAKYLPIVSKNALFPTFGTVALATVHLLVCTLNKALHVVAVTTEYRVTYAYRNVVIAVGIVVEFAHFVMNKAAHNAYVVVFFQLLHHYKFVAAVTSANAACSFAYGAESVRHSLQSFVHRRSDRTGR